MNLFGAEPSKELARIHELRNKVFILRKKREKMKIEKKEEKHEK
jgi:hypothetical protein